MGRLVYELRVRGPVPAELLEEIGAEDFGEEPPLTILRTEPTDQPGLHGMLQRLRSLGLDLMEVRTAGPDPFDSVPALPPGVLRPVGVAALLVVAAGSVLVPVGGVGAGSTVPRAYPSLACRPRAGRWWAPGSPSAA